MIITLSILNSVEASANCRSINYFRIFYDVNNSVKHLT